MGGGKEIEELYSRLVRYYSRHSLTPRKEVERRIAEKMSQGKRREEAIRELYEEENRAIIELTKPKPGVRALTKLEASLEPLRQAVDPEMTVGLSFFFAFIVVLLAALLAPLGGLAVGALILGALFVPLLALLSSGANVSWKFEEEILVEGAGEMLNEVLEAVPKVYQALTLEETSARVEGNKLFITVRLAKAVTEKGSYGSTFTRSVDLGQVSINALFESKDGDLLVRASYAGEPPVEYASLAADEYEKLVVAFRTAVEEAWVRVKPRVVVALDFARLAELIASKGLVIAAVRCPYCGGSVELPKDGDTVKCPYCGTTLKAMEIYELIRHLVRELA